MCLLLFGNSFTQINCKFPKTILFMFLIMYIQPTPFHPAFLFFSKKMLQIKLLQRNSNFVLLFEPLSSFAYRLYAKKASKEEIDAKVAALQQKTGYKNEAFPNSILNMDVFEKASKDASLNFEKKTINQENFDSRLDAKVARIRGGRNTEYEGADDVLDTNWSQYEERIANSIPNTTEAFRKRKNTDSSGWIFPSAVIDPLKPGQNFDRTQFGTWAQGSAISKRARVQHLIESQMQIPQFKSKPADPFAKKPHLIKRISYKVG